ncbi:MAG: hypothetical protein NC111_01885 [Bacteroides sp.]|nr:hypothetical protein [Bacteroides sp.]MCM1414183.1 hypothetical protein [Bacteroides sp.]MCM1471267.1 hypothetical protein [Bacteroides sp.]
MDKLKSLYRQLGIILIIELIVGILSIVAIFEWTDDPSLSVFLSRFSFGVAVLVTIWGTVVSSILRSTLKKVATQAKGAGILMAGFITMLTGMISGFGACFGISLYTYGLLCTNNETITIIATPICIAAWFILWISAIRMARNIPAMKIVKFGTGCFCLVPILFFIYILFAGKGDMPKIINLLVSIIAVIGFLFGVFCMIFGYFKTSTSVEKDENAILTTPDSKPKFLKRWRIPLLISLGVYVLLLIIGFILKKDPEDRFKSNHFDTEQETKSVSELYEENAREIQKTRDSISRTISKPAERPVASTPTAEENVSFTVKGTVGKSAIEMHLTTENNAIKGRYRYTRSGSGDWIEISGIKNSSDYDYIMYEEYDGKVTGTWEMNFTITPVYVVGKGTMINYKGKSYDVELEGSCN